MRINESQAEKYLGMILLVFSLLLYFVIIPNQIAFIPNATTSPRFVPKIIAAILILLSILLAISGYLKKDKVNQKEYSISKKEGKLVLLTLIVMAIYTFAVEYIKFLPASIIILAFLMFVFGQKTKEKWWLYLY